jgi:hypothetical protein
MARKHMLHLGIGLLDALSHGLEFRCQRLYRGPCEHRHAMLRIFQAPRQLPTPLGYTQGYDDAILRPQPPHLVHQGRAALALALPDAGQGLPSVLVH